MMTMICICWDNLRLLKPFQNIFRTSLLLIGSGGFGLKLAEHALLCRAGSDRVSLPRYLCDLPHGWAGGQVGQVAGGWYWWTRGFGVEGYLVHLGSEGLERMEAPKKTEWRWAKHRKTFLSLPPKWDELTRHDTTNSQIANLDFLSWLPRAASRTGSTCSKVGSWKSKSDLAMCRVIRS